MVRAFLVTANVGSVYDNMEIGLPIWQNEFISVVRSRDPEFVAIHFQETGGKGIENVNETADLFVRQLVSRMEDIGFRVAAGFIDTRTEVEDQYTALSSIYFVHESLRLPVHIWDFQDSKFHEVSWLSTCGTGSTSNIYMGPQLDKTHRKQKEKFPQHFYPNCKWSRKGFLRTRWRFGKTSVDFVNIHAFHDMCNLVAASTFPSPFAQNREKTLKYTLDRIQSDGLEKCPLFIFGDFNFRVDAHGVMNALRKDFNDLPESEIVLETKRFYCPEQELRFMHNYEWLKEYDFEPRQFAGLLQEQDLNFHPTYPHEEDVNNPEKFMRTRIPAWCDRVLFTPSTKDIMAKDFPVDYSAIGRNVCMGDHKPVGLLLKIRTDDRPLSALNSNSGQVPSMNDSHSPIKGNVMKKAKGMPVDLGKSCIPEPVPSFADSYGDGPPFNDGNVNPPVPVGSLLIASSDGIAKNVHYEESESGLESPTSEDCKCLGASWFRLRGKMSHNSGSGGGGNSKASFLGLSFPNCRKGCSRSSSLLEPITKAACRDTPLSSLPSSGCNSQRASVIHCNGIANDINGDTLDLFTVPNGNSKLGRDFYRKCTNCHGSSLLPPPNSTVSGQLAALSNNSGCNNGTCSNRSLMMNLTSVINNTQNNKHSGLSSSNLSLIQINTNNDMEKNQGISELNDKIPVCWANYMNNCKDCELISSKNLCHQNNCKSDKIRHSKKNCNDNAYAFNFRPRSASQGSVSIHNFKCKSCAKDDMVNSKSKRADKDGCVSCSKCVIL